MGHRGRRINSCERSCIITVVTRSEYKQSNTSGYVLNNGMVHLPIAERGCFHYPIASSDIFHIVAMASGFIARQHTARKKAKCVRMIWSGPPLFVGPNENEKVITEWRLTQETWQHLNDLIMFTTSSDINPSMNSLLISRYREIHLHIHMLRAHHPLELGADHAKTGNTINQKKCHAWHESSSGYSSSHTMMQM